MPDQTTELDRLTAILDDIGSGDGIKLTWRGGSARGFVTEYVNYLDHKGAAITFAAVTRGPSGARYSWTYLEGTDDDRVLIKPRQMTTATDRLTDERLREFRDNPNVCTTATERALATELLKARQLLALTRLTDDDLNGLHRGLVDHARAHMHVDTDDEQQAADTWLSGYSEGIEHALDTARLRAHAAAPNPEPSPALVELSTAQPAPREHGNSASVASSSPFVPPMPPAQARRQLLSPFDYPTGLADDDAHRAGEIVAGYLDDVLDRVDLACTDDLDMGDEGEREVLRTLGVIAVEAARCIGWTPPSSIGYITGYRQPDGQWHIMWDGAPYDHEAATDDMHEAVTEIPGVDWRVLTVLNEAGGPYLAAEELGGAHDALAKELRRIENAEERDTLPVGSWIYECDEDENEAHVYEHTPTGWESRGADGYLYTLPGLPVIVLHEAAPEYTGPNR
ncbi:hypothetical protein [Nocardia abscessus]|uniref:hypothetical protein n=1 Tax=Nocardia abscessus TaxID=120957 RepID=UPI0024537713|nr:hypothetical protein [Nocardia abscessus]